MCLLCLCICACEKKAKLIDINYNELIDKIDNNENFVLSIKDNDSANYKSYEKNLKKVIEDYYINVYSINIEEIKDKKLFDNITNSCAIFIKNSKEVNSYLRIKENMSYEQMIEIFKGAEYID